MNEVLDYMDNTEVYARRQKLEVLYKCSILYKIIANKCFQKGNKGLSNCNYSSVVLDHQGKIQ